MSKATAKDLAKAVAAAKAVNTDDDGRTLHAPSMGWAWCGARSTRFAPRPKDVNCPDCREQMKAWRQAQ